MDIIYRSRYLFECGEWQQVQYYAYCFQFQEFKVMASGKPGAIKMWTWSNTHNPSSPSYFGKWEHVIRAAEHYMKNIPHMLLREHGDY